MKKRLSAYWRCQIGGWLGYCLLFYIIYYSSRDRFRDHFIPIIFLQAVMGILITHVIRFFLIKFRLFQLNVLKQGISILFITAFFAIIYGIICVCVFDILQWDKFSTFYSFLRNLTRQSSYFFWILIIWNIIYFFYYYIKRSQREQIEKISLENKFKMQQLHSERIEAKLQQQKTALEMQALRAQMNPHFIFNCLSSINSFILKNKTEEASKYLTKFSRLIRMVLNNSKEALISLEDELETLRLYLDMEKLRFKNSFDYGFNFKNAVEVENIFIPPLLLQPFAENAIWHGLMHKQGRGFLNFDLSTEEKILTCVITDNGVGREKAETLKSKSAENQKSMGLKITTDRLNLLNNNPGERTVFTIDDLTDESGNASGTRIHLKIYYKEIMEMQHLKQV